MSSFNNLKQLENYIRKNTKKALQDDIARKIYDTLQKYVLGRVYNTYSPTEYERTYELLKAITIGDVKQIGDGYEIEIYFDADKMYHTSLFGSEKLNIKSGERVYIAEWVDKGYSFGRPSDVDFMKYTMEELEKLQPHIKSFIGYMKTKGVIIK